MPDKQIKFNTPALSYLNDENIMKLHHSSLKLLANTGSKICHPAAGNLLKENKVDISPDGMACIPDPLDEGILEKINRVIQSAEKRSHMPNGAFCEDKNNNTRF